MPERTAPRLLPAPSLLPALNAYEGRPVVVGAGLAGLLTALDLAPMRPVLIMTGEPGTECASDLAQGGLAAAIGSDDDVELHAQDTIAAGAGLCDPDVVRAITARGPAAVRRLLALGARIDLGPDGAPALGLEGAHRRHRIIHAGGDGSGHEFTRAAAAAVLAHPTITVLPHTGALRLTTDDSGAITGLVVGTADGAGCIATRRVVLATGGTGSLYRYTTNPRGARGSGLALGLRAGAAVRDLEFVQFHPTALDVDLDPMPLVSEAVRGHGARLIDETGGHLMEDDLAARDVVARAVWAALERGRRVFLDTPTALGPDLAREFPTVTAAAHAAGIDPAVAPLPIRPAAHYHMGGLLVDLHGRTTVPGLWAVGEVASTGLHGANRLASNSLLEAVVCSQWVAADVTRHVTRHVTGHAAADGRGPAVVVTQPPEPPEGWRAAAQPDPRVRAVLTRTAGVLRDGRGLTRAVAELADGALDNDMRLVGLVLAWSALHRAESRGGHTRTDHPGQSRPQHTVTTLDAVLADCRQAGHQQERSA